MNSSAKISVVDAVSLLAIDLGSISTRAHLFDVADGQYRFIASGISPTTLYSPFFDIGEGIYQAVNKLQQVTGRILLDKECNIILPSQAGGEGIDRLVVTYSCGKELKIVTFGLLADVSLESANRLAAVASGKIVESIGINDRRSLDEQMDAVLNAKPDLILFTGGTDQGASRSVLKMADLVSRILSLTPQENRPEVIYAGNRALIKPVKDRLERYAPIHTAANLRPQVDRETLDEAQDVFSQVVTQVRSQQVNGLGRLEPICSVPPRLSAQGLGKIIQFLSRVNDPAKGVLGIDIGASFSSAAAAFGGSVNVNQFTYGTGSGLSHVLESVALADIQRWLPGGISLEELNDALHQKKLFPASIPQTAEALSIEQAVARQILHSIIHEMRTSGAITTRAYDPILVSGSVLTQAASPQQLLLMLLDGIQPVGISSLILDSHLMLSSLGAAAEVEPSLPVQVLESTAFTNLATVVNVVSDAKPGTPILRAHLEYKSGSFADIEVKKGTIAALPLNSSEFGKLYLEPLHRSRVEAGGMVEDYYKVSGGLCGVVIDGRGRPLELPDSADERTELFTRWAFTLGG